MTKILIRILCGIAITGVLGCSPNSEEKPPAIALPNKSHPGDLDQFVRTADKVELVFNRGYSADPTSELNQKHPVEKIILEDPEQVNAFLSDVKLVAKPACECEHGQMIVFWKDQKKIEVSICDHCFDIMVKGGVKTFEMPKPLYGRFQKFETQFRQGQKKTPNNAIKTDQ